jgi:hypothetical protein
LLEGMDASTCSCSCLSCNDLIECSMLRADELLELFLLGA